MNHREKKEDYFRTSAPQKHSLEKKEKRKRKTVKKNLHSPPPSPNYSSPDRMVEKENYQREKEVTQEENRRKEYGDEKNYHENRILD